MLGAQRGGQLLFGQHAQLQRPDLHDEQRLSLRLGMHHHLLRDFLRGALCSVRRSPPRKPTSGVRVSTPPARSLIAH